MLTVCEAAVRAAEGQLPRSGAAFACSWAAQQRHVCTAAADLLRAVGAAVSSADAGFRADVPLAGSVTTVDPFRVWRVTVHATGVGGTPTSLELAGLLRPALERAGYTTIVSPIAAHARPTTFLVQLPQAGTGAGAPLAVPPSRPLLYAAAAGEADRAPHPWSRPRPCSHSVRLPPLLHPGRTRWN